MPSSEGEQSKLRSSTLLQSSSNFSGSLEPGKNVKSMCVRDVNLIHLNSPRRLVDVAILRCVSSSSFLGTLAENPITEAHFSILNAVNLATRSHEDII